MNLSVIIRCKVADAIGANKLSETNFFVSPGVRTIGFKGRTKALSSGEALHTTRSGFYSPVSLFCRFPVFVPVTVLTESFNQVKIKFSVAARTGVGGIF